MPGLDSSQVGNLKHTSYLCGLKLEIRASAMAQWLKVLDAVIQCKALLGLSFCLQYTSWNVFVSSLLFVPFGILISYYSALQEGCCSFLMRTKASCGDQR